MEGPKYDKKSVTSIYEHALKLTGKSLAEVVELPEGVTNNRNRGDLGSLVEKYYFEHTPPNNHDPDFKEAGLELKTTGVVLKSKGYIAKERLVLTMIDFEALSKENWKESLFLKKCQLMLILFYLYSKETPVINRRFVLKPLLYSIPESDLSQIKRDWEFIKQRICDGKAHELSEGDTFYLGACRKGSGGEKESLRRQPFSTELAKSRAFSFKQNFLTKIVQGHSKENVVALGIGKELSFEDAIKNKFTPFVGLSVAEISAQLNYFTKSKSEKSLLSKRILARGGQPIEEFEKAEIQLKTVSLTKTGGCREDMSFPAFNCLELSTQNWEDSDFSYQVETKFLFVVFKADSNGVDRLEKVMYWNMPYEDRLEAMRVWEEAKRRVTVDARNLPKRRESKVAHVRPHAKNKNDVDLTPQGEWLTKRCFWLNGSYIAKVVK
jgi:DNA mismatch repair protein MutH